MCAKFHDDRFIDLGVNLQQKKQTNTHTQTYIYIYIYIYGCDDVHGNTTVFCPSFRLLAVQAKERSLAFYTLPLMVSELF